MRKKKNSQSIGTTPIECPIVNEAETTLSEGGLNTPEKEADGQVTITDNEVEHLVAVKDNVADDLATTPESEVADNISVPDTERDGYPTPSETETKTKAEIKAEIKAETETGTDLDPGTETETEAEHLVNAPEPEAVPLSVNIEQLTACLLTDECEKTGVASLLKTVFEEYDKGAFSEQTLRSLRQAINYERDVQDAFRQGEIKGRNYRIEEYLIEHRNAEEVRQLGSSSAPSRPTPPASVIGGLSAADRKSIWERGNERRVCHH